MVLGLGLSLGLRFRFRFRFRFKVRVRVSLTSCVDGPLLIVSVHSASLPLDAEPNAGADEGHDGHPRGEKGQVGSDATRAQKIQ